MIKDEDIKIFREPDNELNHGNDRGYYLEIYKWKKDDIDQIKQQILTNQKLIGETREVLKKIYSMNHGDFNFYSRTEIKTLIDNLSKND